MRLCNLDDIPVKKIAKDNKDDFECGWNAVLGALDHIPGIAPETLPVAQELREEIKRLNAGIMNLSDVIKNAYKQRDKLRAQLEQARAERDAAVNILVGLKPCEACAHAGIFSSRACEAADYECAACPAACTCRDCRDGSRWRWKGGDEKRLNYVR